MELQFNLFKNDKKTSDNQPDYRGNNKEKTIEVAAWVKQDKNGNNYLSVKVQDAKPKEQQPQQTNTNYSNNHGDSMPF